MTITSNAQAINEAEFMQTRSREAMERIQLQTEETKEVASLTLEELRQQRRQLEVIELQSHSLQAKLKQTDKLLNSFDRWALKLRGKKRAKQEAKGVLAGAKAKQATKSLTKSVDPAVASIKNKVVAQKRPERKKEVLMKSTYQHVEDRNPTMDEEDMAGLYRIDQNDKELDEMLDEIDASLDGIASLCLAMNEETHFQSKNLESVGKIVESSNEKQAVAITRVRSNLTGRWRQAK
jgi:hypothetical protein